MKKFITFWIQVIFPAGWLIIAVGGLILLLSYACTRDKIDTNPDLRLEFSSDTIIFDTVFTSVGSITKSIRVYNRHQNKIRIHSIQLAGGANSRFSINLDGKPGTLFTDVEIPPGDSLYLFAKVTINPGDQTLPFIVKDSVVFETNGNVQDVDLVAWGQNARFILWDTHRPGLPRYKIVAREGVDTTWTNDLPIVVYGYAVVDSTGTLTIQPGTRIHFHSGSGLWVYKGGTLKVLGTLEQPVYFQSDRMDGFYKYLPGQWDRIWINESASDHLINYAIIRNGFIGLQLETLQEYMGNRLILTNTIIENMSGAGILTRFYVVYSHNIAIANCGQYSLAITIGGAYDFRHITIGNYWQYGIRTTPALFLNNHFTNQNNQTFTFPLNAHFSNSIIYGNQQEEIITDFKQEQIELKFDHCLLKTTKDISDPSIYINSFKNEDPRFLDFRNNDLRLDSLSPARNRGSISTAVTVPYDIRGISRIESPDLGAFEWISDSTSKPR